MKDNFVVLGAGAAGLGAVHRFHNEGMRAKVYEKCAFAGGHAASYFSNGWIFDDGPHISFTKDERIRKLFHESVNGEVEAFKALATNYWQGHWIKHPAQVNLHGLPEDMVVKIIMEMMDAKAAEGGEISNYQDWLYASYGPTFSETFPMMYTKKFHTAHASMLDTDWIGPRLYQPDMEEVLHGALSMHTPDVHYISDFYYPTHGGFARFFDQFPECGDMNYGHEVVEIDPAAKRLVFASGQEDVFSGLVSSLPLPELIPLIKGAPVDVVEAAARLACSECVTVNVGIDREDISEAHWTYFYDEDIPFARISFPHMQSPNNTPDGCGSIQMEVYFSKKYKPMTTDADSCIQPAIDGLLKCGLLKPEDNILFKEARYAPYANVIFDLERNAALKLVHGYLDEIGIRYCGRFGEWGYHWTDGSFISGENAAQKILDC